MKAVIVLVYLYLLLCNSFRNQENVFKTSVNARLISVISVVKYFSVSVSFFAVFSVSVSFQFLQIFPFQFQFLVFFSFSFPFCFSLTTNIEYLCTHFYRASA